MKDPFLLLDAIHLAFNRPEYAPKDGSTHCNQYVNEVCQTLGFTEFDGKLANEMVDIIDAHPQWSKVEMNKCQELANHGTLVLAGLKAEQHGHINIICPGKEKTSGRWGPVPSCVNVGKENFIGRGVNWAFGDYPKFWAWRQSL